MVCEFIFLICMLEKPNDLHGCWINGAQIMLNESLMDKMKHTPPRSSCPLPVHACSTSHFMICIRVNLEISILLWVEQYFLVSLGRRFICVVVQLLLTAVASVQTKPVHVSPGFY